jgi:MFS family permease
VIEAYAFLVMFTIQILATSVLYPTWFIRHCRRQATSIPAERLAQVYPGVDVSLAQARFLALYRALNTVIAVLGLLLLGWLFSYLRRPDWDDGPVEALVAAYFMVQVALPLALIVWLGARFNRAHRRTAPQRKRKAVLERRGLFDFVSPVAVLLAVLSYFLFVAYVIYIRQHPFPGFAGLISIGAITLVYALQALVVYLVLYGKKSNPFETHAGRLRRIGLGVKCCVYSCIAAVVFLALNFTLVLLDLQRWEPFALSVFLVITALLSLMGMIAPPRQPEADGLSSRPTY